MSDVEIEVDGHFDWDLGKWVVYGYGMEAVDRSLHRAVAILLRMRASSNG